MNDEMIITLKNIAVLAKENARCERTGFHVGAALLTKNGEIITGCNVELNSTLMSICAERCAVSKAVSMGYTEFEAIAVATDSPYPESPCGICRQFLADFGLDLVVIMTDNTGSETKVAQLRELLPMAFHVM